MSGGSVSFDRAAPFYDETRSLSDQARDQVTDLLVQELTGRGPCLEVGVGTGRIAMPLHRQGIPMTGIDISTGMMARLVEKGGGSPPFPLAVADATRLPFGDQVFGCALASHVLHLITEWQTAVAEIVRTIAEGGLFIAEQGGWPKGVFKEIEQRFNAEAQISKPYVGLAKLDELDEHMTRLGAAVRVLPEIEDVRTVTPGAVVKLLEEGVFSFTWSIAEGERRRAAEATRRWAEKTYGSLDAESEVVASSSWRTYHLP